MHYFCIPLRKQLYHKDWLIKSLKFFFETVKPKDCQNIFVLLDVHYKHTKIFGALQLPPTVTS